MKIENTKLIGKGILILLFTSLFLLFGTFQGNIITVQASSGTFDEDFTTTTYMDGGNTDVEGWGTGSVQNPKKQPLVIGSISSALIGNALDIFISDHIAYATDNIGKFKVVNISDATNPFILGSYDLIDTAPSVFVVNEIAYIAAFDGIAPQYYNFFVLDVSDPKNPVYIGNCSTILAAGDLARDVVVKDDTAFVANSEGGLRVIDVSDPANPTPIGTRDTAGITTNLALIDDFALLADGTNGLVVVDINNPSNPTIETTFSTGISSAINVFAQEDYAYVVDINNGIIIVDITDPTAPTYVSTWSKTSVSDADIFGDYLYVTDLNDGLSVVNVTDSSAPAFISELTLPGFAQTIVIEGIDAYIPCQTGGLRVVRIADISDPPAFIGSQTSIGSRDVIVRKDHVFVADNSNDSLQVFNVSNPASPYLTGFYTFPDAPTNMFLEDDLLYVTFSGVGGFHILNVSDPSSPTFVGGYSTTGYAMGIWVSGDYAYIADGNGGLHIADVSTPSAITYVGSDSSYAATCFAYDIEVRNDLAYVTDLVIDLIIFNVSNPSSPYVVDSYDDSGNGYEVALYGYYACVAHRFEGLQILNISDPTNIALVSYFDTSSDSAYQALGIHASAGYAYIADWGGGVAIVDIGNPKNPVLV
ncbi:MAG: LVIVD repeat-containing protein, partial [Candidatus Heimdallarchaeaceae archaeon]